MPPEIRDDHLNDDSSHNSEPQGSTMRRVVSQAEISVSSDPAARPDKEYYVRKSSLIGYVTKRKCAIGSLQCALGRCGLSGFRQWSTCPLLHLSLLPTST